MLLVQEGNPDNPKNLFANDIIALINNIHSNGENYVALILDANLSFDDSEGELRRLINKTSFLVDTFTETSP
jgi:hypothetical protein